MVVLLCGASGFIGRHLATALAAQGHTVRAVGRAAGVDYTRDHHPQAWLPRLAGVDAVVNAVGILRERGAQTFAAIHERAPKALFTACAEAGVRRVVQVSALGADASAVSGYHRSKKAADDHLLALPVSAAVAMPSLVFGPDGASTRMFAMMASLPLVPVPGAGEQRVQPIHVADLAACLVALIERDAPRGRLALVGPRALSLREYYALLREGLQAGRARFLPVPMPLMNLAARIGDRVPASPVSSETIGMLARGSTADPAETGQLLGRAPRGPETFIEPAEAAGLRLRAKLDWLLPLLRTSLALVWIVAGVVTLGVYPVEQSYALLARAGITGAMAILALYGGAILDLALGVATLVLPRRRLLWLAQAAVILIYTAIITVFLPEFWLHPYGPIVKNLPILAALWLLWELEPCHPERSEGSGGSARRSEILRCAQDDKTGAVP